MISGYFGPRARFAAGRSTRRTPARIFAIDAARQLFPRGLWLDKTPCTNMIHLAPRFRCIWPNAQFIFMQRRGVDNVLSRMRKWDADFAGHWRASGRSGRGESVGRDGIADGYGRECEIDADAPEDFRTDDVGIFVYGVNRHGTA